jgi:hypothetical protein
VRPCPFPVSATQFGRLGATSSVQLWTPWAVSQSRAADATAASPQPSSGARHGFTEGVRIRSCSASRTFDCRLCRWCNGHLKLERPLGSRNLFETPAGSRSHHEYERQTKQRGTRRAHTRESDSVDRSAKDMFSVANRTIANSSLGCVRGPSHSRRTQGDRICG